MQQNNSEDRVLEVLTRLHEQGKPRGYKAPVIIREIFKDVRMASEPIRTIQQNKVKDVMSSIDNMERKMKSSSSSYLSLYYDLMKLEKKFLQVVEEMEKSDTRIPELFHSDIEKRRTRILEKHNKFQNFKGNEYQ